MALKQTVRVAFIKHRMRFPKYTATYSRSDTPICKNNIFPRSSSSKDTSSWPSSDFQLNWAIKPIGEIIESCMNKSPSTRVGINRQTSFEYVVGCGWTLLSNRDTQQRGDTLQEVQFCGRDDLPMLNQRSPLQCSKCSVKAIFINCVWFLCQLLKQDYQPSFQTMLQQNNQNELSVDYLQI